MDADTLVYQATKGNPVVATIQLHIHRHAPPQNYPEIISADEEQQDCPTTTSDYPTRPFIRTSERSGAGRRIARRTSRKTWPSPPPSRWPNSRGQRTSRPTRRSYQRLRCRRLRGRSQQTPLPCIKAVLHASHASTPAHSMNSRIVRMNFSITPTIPTHHGKQPRLTQIQLIFDGPGVA